MLGMPSHGGVDTSQGKLTGCVLIAIRMLPCNGAPALLEQAFDMRISMQAQCKTRLHVALVTHTFRQTNGENEKVLNIWLITADRLPGAIVALCGGSSRAANQHEYNVM